MSRKILTQAQALNALSPYSDKIVKAIQQGFASLDRLCLWENGRMIQLEQRTRCSFIHDAICNFIRIEFEEADPNLEIGKWNNIFGMKIQEKLFLRFKKFNRECAPSLYPSRQTRRYLDQLSIEGIPNEPTLLFVGYVASKDWSELEDIFVTCQIQEKIEWKISLFNSEFHTIANSITDDNQIQLPYYQMLAPALPQPNIG
jgi:hypothetical protein